MHALATAAVVVVVTVVDDIVAAEKGGFGVAVSRVLLFMRLETRICRFYRDLTLPTIIHILLSLVDVVNSVVVVAAAVVIVLYVKYCLYANIAAGRTYIQYIIDLFLWRQIRIALLSNFLI
jgi:hypothetical protein